MKGVKSICILRIWHKPLKSKHQQYPLPFLISNSWLPVAKLSTLFTHKFPTSINTKLKNICYFKLASSNPSFLQNSTRNKLISFNVKKTLNRSWISNFIVSKTHSKYIFFLLSYFIKKYFPRQSLKRFTFVSNQVFFYRSFSYRRQLIWHRSKSY